MLQPFTCGVETKGQRQSWSACMVGTPVREAGAEALRVGFPFLPGWPGRVTGLCHPRPDHPQLRTLKVSAFSGQF